AQRLPRGAQRHAGRGHPHRRYRGGAGGGGEGRGYDQHRPARLSGRPPILLPRAGWRGTAGLFGERVRWAYWTEATVIGAASRRIRSRIWSMVCLKAWSYWAESDLSRGSFTLSGSTVRPLTRISKCRWLPVELPVEPT